MDFTLRRWRTEDAPDLVRYADNRNVSRFLTDGFPHPYSLSDAERFIASVMPDEPTKVFAIDVAGTAVGSVGIFPQADVHRISAEVGYWLAEEFWGKGIMTEAVRRIVGYGFGTFDISRIFARPFGKNRASQRILEKAGFVHEATLSKSIIKSGEVMDELIYSIRKEDWERGA